MKYTLNINQQQAIALGLKNATEAIIFGMICDCATWAEPVIIDSEVFYWTSRSKFVSDLPLLDLKVDTVYRYLKSLEKLGLISYKKQGVKDCVKLTKLGKSYYVGKKSESEDFAMSEKNPTKLGKKSENDSEKNPTYSSISSYSSINHSSSTPPPIEEEEGVVSAEVVPHDPYLEIPEEGMQGLTREQIVFGVEHLVALHAGDEESYRKSLLWEILSGRGRTLRNIRRQLAPRPGRRTGSNRAPVLPAGIDVFELYEARSGELPGGET
ncbi:MAG: helix-turn-helix domain-containing protein [Campylobacterota bacterium]